MSVKQAVIPAAGLGSRFLPVTKNMPKELLPLLDRPCIQHVVDEAIKAGVEEFIIVVSPEKKQIQSYFEPNAHLNKWLEHRGKSDMLQILRDIETKAKFKFAIQEEPLGLGHAVLCAQDFVTDDHFFVLLPDDIIDAEVPVCQQMNEAFLESGCPLVSVMEVAWEQVHRYGIVQGDPLSDTLGDVKSIVEKPERHDAPSNLAVIGRYLLPKKIFPLIENTKPGAGGEIQLTDALRGLVDQEGLNSFAFKGDRFDTGTPVGLLQASIAMSLKNPDYRDQISQQIKILAASL